MESKKVRLVYIGIFLTLVKTFCDRSNIIPYPDILDDMVSAIILFIFVVIIIKRRYPFKIMMIYTIISVIAIYSAIASEYKIIAVTVLMLLAIRKESLDEIACFLFKWKSFFLIINTMMAILLWILRLADIGAYYENGTRYRMHFGYGMAGHFADYILDLLVLWVWLHYKEIKRQDYIKIFLFSLVVYLCSDSRMFFINVVLLIGLLWVTKRTQKFDWIICKTAQLIIPILTAFMLCAIKLFENGNVIGYKIDSMFNTRVRLNGYKLYYYGITWFGRKCPVISGEWSPIWRSAGGAFDCVYTWMIIEMGIIWLVILIIGVYLLAKRKNTLINILLIVWALGALIDTDFLNGTCSFSILFLSLLLSKHEKCMPLQRNSEGTDL